MEQPKFTKRKGIHGNWQAGFTIGVQTFHLQENGNSKHADWYISMLKKAFNTLDEGMLLHFCHFINEKGYKINGYDDGMLETVIKHFLDEYYK